MRLERANPELGGRRRASAFLAATAAIASLVVPVAEAGEDHPTKPVAAAAQDPGSSWTTSVSIHGDKPDAATRTKANSSTKPKAANPTIKAEAATPAAVAKPEAAPQAPAPAVELKAPRAHTEGGKPSAAHPSEASGHAAVPPAPAPAPEKPVPEAPSNATRAPATATPSSPVAEQAAAPVAKGKQPGDRPPEKPVQSYCVNITNSALDARYLRQKKFLDDLKEEVRKRTTELEATIATYKEWLARRDEFVSKSQDSLVAIYGNMKSEPAAKQLSELDEETASSVLAKLEARQSSAIVGEMDPKKAARLMEIIAGAGKFSPKGTDTPSEQSQQAATNIDAAEADVGVQ